MRSIVQWGGFEAADGRRAMRTACGRRLKTRTAKTGFSDPALRHAGAERRLSAPASATVGGSGDADCGAAAFEAAQDAALALRCG
jgi:hypothetical protein